MIQSAGKSTHPPLQHCSTMTHKTINYRITTLKNYIRISPMTAPLNYFHMLLNFYCVFQTITQRVWNQSCCDIRHFNLYHAAAASGQTHVAHSSSCLGGLWNRPLSKRMWPQRAASSLIPSLPSRTQLSNSTAPTSTAYCSTCTWKEREA